MTNIFNNLDWSVLTNILIAVIPALICITLHELAHGFTAYRLGDRTAKDMGRLTLNPIKHIDIFGLLMMVIFRFGWAKPVPVDMRNFKKPKWYMAITAIAGPLSNIVIAIVAFFIFGLVITSLGGSVLFDVSGLGITPENIGEIYNDEGSVFIISGGGVVLADGIRAIIIEIIYITAYISIAFAVFNMLPIPPLDGSKVIFSLLPEKAYYNLMRYERYGMILLIIFISVDRFINVDIFDATIGHLTRSLEIGLSNIWVAAFNLVN